MPDLGLNEHLTIREGADGAYFALYPANTHSGVAYYGNIYTVIFEENGSEVRAYVPMHTQWSAAGRSREDAKAALERVIREDLRRQEDLLAKYIRLDLSESGVDQARVMPANAPVWLIIGQLEGAHGDIARVAEDWELPENAVEAAQIFYRRNRAAIDARRLENSPGRRQPWQPDTMPR